MSLEETIDPSGVYLVVNEQLGTAPTTILYCFGDDVYEQIIYAEMWPDYSDCHYLFVNGNTLIGYETLPEECDSDGFRFVEILKDTVVETVCFSACVDCNAIGTAEISRPSTAMIYPNPCQASATLEFNDAETVHNVTVTDILGKTVKNYKDYKLNSLIISRDNLKAGVYFVKIESPHSWLNTLRLVIRD
jgi:hypothetical protein